MRPHGQTLDVRVIGAASSSVISAVDDGRLLDDFGRRLPLVIDVPPLRQRREDVGEIAGRILAERAPGRQFTPAALTVLAALPWRRNIAELRALIDRLATLAQTQTIRQEEVLAEVQLDRPPLRPGSNLREARRQFERDHIASVLRDHGWQMREAARALGMERANLYRKARQLGIPLRRGAVAAARVGAMTRLSFVGFRLRRFTGLVAAGLILALPIALSAQTYPEPPDPAENARVRMGPFSVRPTLIIRDVGIDSNVFNASGIPQEDFSFTAGARVDVGVRLNRILADIFEQLRIHVLPEVQVRARLQPRIEWSSGLPARASASVPRRFAGRLARAAERRDRCARPSPRNRIWRQARDSFSSPIRR